MNITCKLEIECIEDENGLGFRITRQGNNVSLPIYFMLLEYAKNELIKTMSKNHAEEILG